MKFLILLLQVTPALLIFQPQLIRVRDRRFYYDMYYNEPVPEEIDPSAPRYQDDVVVVFKGTFKCQRKNFCAVIYYTEEDRFYGDFMGYVPLHCTRTNYLKHDIILNLKDFAGWFEGEDLEPKIKIFHDCIDVGVLKGVEIELSSVSRYEPFHVISYTESLWRRGITPYKPRIDYYFFYYSSWGYKYDQNTQDWKTGEDVTGREDLFYRPLVYFKDIEVDKEGNINVVKD